MPVGRTQIQKLLGQALSFDGVTTTARKAVLTDGTIYSAFCWIYITATPGGTITIIKNGETGVGNGGWQFYLNSSRNIGLKDPGGVWGGAGSTVLALNTWYHVGFIQNGTSTQMYLNGVAEGSAISGSHNSCQTDFTVGCTHNTSSGLYQEFFKGYVQDVRVWNRVLSSDEITKLYNITEINSIVSLPMSTANLMVWFPFNGNANDNSGNAANLTLGGTIAYVNGKVYITNMAPRTLKTSLTYITGRTLLPN